MRRSPDRTLLRIETLEDRTVPSATPAFASDRLLVTFADVNPAAKSVAEIGRSPLAESVTSLGLGIYRVDLAAGVDFDRAITVFSAQAGVQFVGRDSVVSVAQTPNDPRLSELWSLQKIDAAQGWNVTTGTGRTVVAVIDTGVDYRHPDLAANIWTNTIDPATGGLHGYDFSDSDTDPMDENGHGTHVAGIVGATGNNGVGVTGIAQRAQIMVLRFMDAAGNGYTSDAVRAIDYAIRHGAKILNNSWGGASPDPALAAAIERARAAGVIVVIAAGNEQANNDATASYPAAYAKQSNNVVVVASTDSNDQLSWFSNYGPQSVLIAAPGESILSTARGGGYITKSGTSMATPVISGALALLWDLHPTWTYSQILEKLKISVDPVTRLSGKVASGGRIDLGKLLGASTIVPPVTSPPVTSPPPSSTPGLRWDSLGPKVVSAVFTGSNSTSFNTVRVTFDKKINAPTFTASDVALTGPNGKLFVTGVTAVANTNNSVFDVTFASQTAAGNYSATIGPNIWDVQAKRLDQNGNGIGNEAADAYTAAGRLGGATSPPVSTSRKTYGATANNVAIADQRTTQVNFEVTDSFNISNITVNLDATHTRMADLQIRLRAPDGRTVVLFNRRSLSLSGITFDDGAANVLSANSLTRGASVRPEEVLAGFGGHAARGTWTLEIFDLFAGNTGTVRSASLTFGTSTTRVASLHATGSLTHFAGVDFDPSSRHDHIAGALKKWK